MKMIILIREALKHAFIREKGPNLGELCSQKSLFYGIFEQQLLASSGALKTAPGRYPIPSNPHIGLSVQYQFNYDLKQRQRQTQIQTQK